MTTDLALFNNSWYKPGASKIRQMLWFFVNAIVFKSAVFPFSGLKVFLLSSFGAKIGKGVIIKPSVNIKYPWRLCVGSNSWIGENVWIDNLDHVTIGNNCCISQGAMLLCGNHNYKLPAFDLITKPIIIDDGVWIGAQSVVCPGIVCKSHSILSVASIATKNLDSYSVYQGNPAVKVKERIIEDSHK
jgi:putative colanic acid biosynthesis acetyltransferase WcaF